MSDPAFFAAVRDAALKLGLGEIAAISPILSEGRNNRIFRLDFLNRSLVLKKYFRHPGDKRDRLRAETAFIGFARAAGIDRVPELAGFDRENLFAFYEFIPGRKLSPGEVGPDFVNQAADFFAAVNARRAEGLKVLPEASEACFSIDAHLDVVDSRIRRLLGMETNDEVSREALSFVRGDLKTEWNDLKSALAGLQGEGAPLSEGVLSPEMRCVSPSDFGFHNAILRPDERIAFIDFEYAGIDDPAKMVCDFFHQPAVPVPEEFLPSFIERSLKPFPDCRAIVRRIGILFRVYLFKWTCILLNEFLPVGSARRDFAEFSRREDKKAVQLSKARDLFARGKSCNYEKTVNSLIPICVRS